MGIWIGKYVELLLKGWREEAAKNTSTYVHKHTQETTLNQMPYQKLERVLGNC
jgi:hypothetical protein